MNPTLRDIAREVGLHPSTVSRAISGRPGVSRQKRALVLHTAARLHYQPNALARGLRSGQQKVVGLVFPDVMNELYSSAATVLASTLAARGYLIQLSLTYDHQETERQALLSLREHQVSGIIIAPCGNRDSVVSRMLASVPVVEFMRGTRARVDKVLWEDADAAYVATSHLLNLGHRNMRFITGVPYVTTTVARVKGFRRALREAGLNESADWVRFGRSVRDWQEATRQLATETPRCTAVIASNHIIALNMLGALEAAGLSIPTDVSVIGLDDPSWFWSSGKGITAVNVPWDQMAQAAGEFLLKRLAEPSGEDAYWQPKTIRFPARLVIRGSTAPPRGLSVAGAIPKQLATRRLSRGKRQAQAVGSAT